MASLLWILERRELFFAYPESFEDPFEGQLPRHLVEELRALKGEIEHNSRFFESMIRERQIGISRWHNHPHESSVMWRAYAVHAGVAIRSSIETLTAALPSNTGWVEPVNYIDYEIDTFTLENVKTPHTHKRSVFSSENEIRAIVWEDIVQMRADDCSPYGASGFGLKITPEALITEIVVGPELGKWFTQSLGEIVKRLGYDIPVVASLVSAAPCRIFREDVLTILTPWRYADQIAFPRYIFAGPSDSNPTGNTSGANASWVNVPSPDGNGDEQSTGGTT